jgi:KDO2-lipid IV(A) lauroyltransferase
MTTRSAAIMLRIGAVYRRCWSGFLNLLGPRAAYALVRTQARIIYRLFDPVRLHTEAQCRAVYAGRLSEAEIRDLARRSFIHRSLNLADLMLAPRRLRPDRYRRYGLEIPQPHLDLLRAAQAQKRPVILVTAYYGPYDLLPGMLGCNGLAAGVVYRPHRNQDFDALRRSVRAATGCELITVDQSTTRLPEMLEAGRTVAILSDHEASRRGVSVTFLGRPTTYSRAVGLLAARHEAAVAVAGIRRRQRPFRFEIVVTDWFGPEAWASEADPVAAITRRYVAGIEALVAGDPSQYMWAHRRWAESAEPAGASEPTPGRPA